MPPCQNHYPSQAGGIAPFLPRPEPHVLLPAVRGFVRTHDVVVALADVDGKAKEALRVAAGARRREPHRARGVLLRRMATLKPAWLPS